MKPSRYSIRWLPAFFTILVLLSCNMPEGLSFSSGQDSSLEETQVALGIQSTMLASQKATLDAAILVQPTLPPVQPPVQQPSNTQAPELAATYTPYPTYTVPPTEEAQPSDTPQPTPENMDEKIRSANVLVFEDIRGYPALDTRVHQAVNLMGFSGGKVVEVGDAVGNFMEQLNSATRWDLIVVSAEARQGVRGEFWDVILQQVNRDVALVAEVWYLDDIASGRISPLLSKCGVKFQKDWGRPSNYNQLDYSIYWLDQFNEVFSNPNTVGPLYTPNIYWQNDAGDLLMLGAGGDATLLAGLYPNQKSSYGVLTSCLEGRMILQTYSTHDYRSDHVVPLWQNFMTYTLTNHFNSQK